MMETHNTDKFDVFGFLWFLRLIGLAVIKRTIIFRLYVFFHFIESAKIEVSRLMIELKSLQVIFITPVTIRSVFFRFFFHSLVLTAELDGLLDNVNLTFWSVGFTLFLGKLEFVGVFVLLENLVAS